MAITLATAIDGKTADGQSSKTIHWLTDYSYYSRKDKKMNSLLCINHTSAHIQGAGSQSISHLSTASSAERMDSEKTKTAPAVSPSPAPRMDEYIPERERSREGIREMKQNERKAAPDAADGPDTPKPEEETCTTDTDRVDAEIRRLREKLEKLQQQLAGAGNQPQEQHRLEQQITRAQQELQAKDTDTYRRQQAEYRMG